jgi:hypothetical protein
MTNSNFTPRVHHTLLIPRKFRLRDDQIEWTDVRAREVDPDETVRCLWDFITLSEETVERLPGFVRRWGLLESTGESPATPGEDGTQMIEVWTESASEAGQLTGAIAKTEDAELLSEGALWALRHGDRRNYHEDLAAELRSGRVSAQELFERAYERQRAYYTSERRASRGVALQRGLIVNLLGEFATPPEWRSYDAPASVPLSFVYSWDDAGRRLEARASGVREIVAAQLVSMFSQSELDVFICSVCGKPFSTETTEAQRRPRRGVKRLCSDECRKAAKRESNRSSWNKHKDRWRPPSTNPKKRPEEPTR